MTATVRVPALMFAASLVTGACSLQSTTTGDDNDRYKASDNPIPDRYIVVLADDAAARSGVGALAADLAADYAGTVREQYKSALSGFSADLTKEDALRLSEDPRVAYVQEDGVVSIDAAQTPATWGLDRTDQRDLPLDNTYNYNATGAGVSAYIIDTGIRLTHSDFGGRATFGFDSMNDGQNGNDCNGHGTHVAGTVAGTQWGLAKAANLVAVRVLSCAGSGTWEGVIAGIDWVTANAQLPAVANMSLGGGVNQAVDDAVTRSIESGVVYAIAAGNSNTNACTFSPARTPNAITVGATNRMDRRASFSNFGTCLDIFAPGVGITSAWRTNDMATNTIDGTSMAAPHVAGAVALYLETQPMATALQVRDALVAEANKGKVINPGLNSPNELLHTGFITTGDGTSE